MSNPEIRHDPIGQILDLDPSQWRVIAEVAA